MIISLKKVSTGRQKRNPGFDQETRDFLKVANNCNFVSGHARHFILVSNPRFWGMRNHLGPFSLSSDRSESQEQAGGTVGGQG